MNEATNYLRQAMVVMQATKRSYKWGLASVSETLAQMLKLARATPVGDKSPWLVQTVALLSMGREPNGILSLLWSPSIEVQILPIRLLLDRMPGGSGARDHSKSALFLQFLQNGLRILLLKNYK